jgi:hypothetical protein
MTQENQRIRADELATELDQEARNRGECVVAYILRELDLASGPSVPSSG